MGSNFACHGGEVSRKDLPQGVRCGGACAGVAKPARSTALGSGSSLGLRRGLLSPIERFYPSMMWVLGLLQVLFKLAITTLRAINVSGPLAQPGAISKPIFL